MTSPLALGFFFFSISQCYCATYYIVFKPNGLACSGVFEAKNKAEPIQCRCCHNRRRRLRRCVRRQCLILLFKRCENMVALAVLVLLPHNLPLAHAPFPACVLVRMSSRAYLFCHLDGSVDIIDTLSSCLRSRSTHRAELNYFAQTLMTTRSDEFDTRAPLFRARLIRTRTSRWCARSHNDVKKKIKLFARHRYLIDWRGCCAMRIPRRIAKGLDAPLVSDRQRHTEWECGFRSLTKWSRRSGTCKIMRTFSPQAVATCKGGLRHFFFF